MTSRIWIWALVLPLTLAPEAARSQCCTMPSGSGDHARMEGEARSERKVRKDIDRLLSSERSRGLLIEALLQDRDIRDRLVCTAGGCEHVFGTSAAAATPRVPPPASGGRDRAAPDCHAAAALHPHRSTH